MALPSQAPGSWIPFRTSQGISADCSLGTEPRVREGPRARVIKDTSEPAKNKNKF